MTTKSQGRSLLATLPPWIFIGAAAILFPIFAFITLQNINREKESSSRLLLEKGAALIRSFEAGTRTGMMGVHWDGFGLQRLLTETARQQDILYILVTDTSGKILAHNNPIYIGQTHETGLDLFRIYEIETVRNRVVKTSENRKIFEVFRKFSPSGGRFGMHRGRMMFPRFFERPGEEQREFSNIEMIIFVGLDMSAVEEASQADTRHTIIMGIILLLIGFSGIVLLFLAQNYHATKSSLSRIKAFSDHLVENMPVGLIATDTNGQIASLNPVAISILSLPQKSHIGKPATEILPNELGNLVSNPDQEKVNTEIEINCTRQDGKTIPLQVISSSLTGESNRFLGQIMLLKDLTEVRALEQEVARSRRLAAVGRLAAGVAHEIRNPLSSIKGFATYFKERYREKSEDQHISNIMIQEVDRLNKVVGQLLDFSRPVTITKKEVDARSFIENSVKIVEGQAKEKGISITTSISNNINTLRIDPDRISQVLLNLYLNAIEAMEKGGVLSVSLSRSTTPGEVQFQISDTGIGIPAENIDHIFDPYFTTKASGTGLGLAIVHNIIEAHNGEINVQSLWGKGTTILVLLPDTEGAA